MYIFVPDMEILGHFLHMEIRIFLYIEIQIKLRKLESSCTACHTCMGENQDPPKLEKVGLARKRPQLYTTLRGGRP